MKKHNAHKDSPSRRSGLPKPPSNANAAPDTHGEITALDEMIAAYVCEELGEGAGLGAEARRAFEQRMAAEPELAAQVQAQREALLAAKEWFSAPPPGLERAEEIPIPKLKSGAARSITAKDVRPTESRGRRLWALFQFGIVRPAFALSVALLVFCAGYWAGRGERPSAGAPARLTAETTGRTMPSNSQPATAGAVPGAPPPAPANIPAPKSAPTPEPSSLSSGGVEMASLKSRTFVRDDNGRMTIENNRASGGTQSVWVIDNSLSLE